MIYHCIKNFVHKIDWTFHQIHLVFCFGVCFLQGWWNASSSMCSSSGMEKLKYIAFWSGWLPHRSQNMVLALGPEARGCRALQAWRRTRQHRVGNGEAWGGTRAPPPHGDGASATTFFCFFLVQVLPEAGGGEEGERNKKIILNTCGTRKGSWSTTKSGS